MVVPGKQGNPVCVALSLYNLESRESSLRSPNCVRSGLPGVQSSLFYLSGVNPGSPVCDVCIVGTGGVLTLRPLPVTADAAHAVALPSAGLESCTQSK
jgi:hypothetical protein